MTDTQSLHRPAFLRRLSAPIAAPSIASLDDAFSVGNVPDNDSLRPPSALRMGKRLPPLLRMISFRKLRLSTPSTVSESSDGPFVNRVRSPECRGEDAGGTGLSFADVFGKEGKIQPLRGQEDTDSLLGRYERPEKYRETAILTPKSMSSSRGLPLLASQASALVSRLDSPPDLDVRLSTPLKGSNDPWPAATSHIALDVNPLAEFPAAPDALDFLASGRFGRPAAFEQQRCEFQPRKKGTQSLFAPDAASARIASGDDAIDAMSMFTLAETDTRRVHRLVHPSNPQQRRVSRPFTPFKTRRRPVPPMPGTPPHIFERLDEVVVIDRFVASTTSLAPPARPPRSQARPQPDAASLRSLPASLPGRSEKRVAPLATASPVFSPAVSPASPLSIRSGNIPARGSSLPAVPKRSGSLLRRTKLSSVKFDILPLVHRKPTGPRPRPPPLALPNGRVVYHRPARSQLEPRVEHSPVSMPRTPVRRLTTGMTALDFLALDAGDHAAAGAILTEDELEKTDGRVVSPTGSSPAASPHIVPPEELSLYSPRRHDRNMSDSSDVTYRHFSPKSTKRSSSTTPYALTLSSAIGGRGEAPDGTTTISPTPRRPSTPASSPRTPGPASVFGSPMSARGRMPMSSPPPPLRSKTPYPPARTPTSPRSPTRARQPIALPLSLGSARTHPRPVSRSSFLLSPAASVPSSGTPSPDPTLEDHPFFTPCPTPRKHAVREQEDAISHGLRLSAFTVLDSPSRPSSTIGLRQPFAPLENRSDMASFIKHAEQTQASHMGTDGVGRDDKDTLGSWLSQPVKRPMNLRVATFGQGFDDWD